MGSVLLDGVEIGDDSFVAAGSLVTPGKKFPPRSFIMGSPAKRVRDVSDEDIVMMARSAEVYVELMRGYRR
jgi:carbonic anhydrase/acetyltransferase-like protein (isoleucine patch superfamily)